MSKALITQSRDEEGVVVFHMHDEDGHNALGEEFVREFLSHVEQLCADQEAKVCILRGMEGVFCAGGDQKMLLELVSGKVAPADIMLPRVVLDIPIPVIAAVEGHAVGGGLTLALCCDMVLLARESRYGCSFMNMGFTPGMGTTHLLQHAFGEFIAAEMMYGGQFFRGSHFDGRSQLNYVLPRRDVFDKAMQVALRIAEKPRFALELLKRNLSRPKRLAFEDARASEVAMHQICFSQPETRERILENYAPASAKES